MRIKTFLRWIAVLPTALFAFAAIHLINYLQGHIYAIPFDIVRDIICVFIFIGSGIAFVYGGTAMAPNYRKPVSIILCVILCIIMIIGLCVQFTRPDDFLLIDKIYNIAVMLGSVLGVIYIKANGV